MKKNLSTGLLILGGLYILTSRKKQAVASPLTNGPVASTIPNNERVLPMVPVIRDSSKTTPIEKSTIEPIQKFPNTQTTKKIMDPYEDYYPSRTTPVNPKSITKDMYVPIGSDSDEEMYSRQTGEVLPDRDFKLKNVKTNYQNNLYREVQIGYRPTSGFGGSGLADM